MDLTACWQTKETWISKQDVILYSFKNNGIEKRNFAKGTKFYIRKTKNINTALDTYWRFETASLCSSWKGYASKFLFYKENFDLPEEEMPWFFGKVSRTDAREYLLHDLNGDGAFLIRYGSKKNFVLSIKFRDHKKNEWTTVNYQIQRTNKDRNKGEYYIEPKKFYKSIELLLDAYKLESQGHMKTPLSHVCFIPNPDANEKFKAALKLQIDAEAWTISKEELKTGEKLGSGNFGVVNKGTLRETVDVAIKTLIESKDNKDKEAFKKETEAFKKETEIMKKLNHPNLVKMYGIQIKKAPFQLVMELCSTALKSHLESFRNDDRTKGKKTSRLLKHLPNCPKFEDLKDWCEQIALGMIYLEEQKVIHRDLAARNVLLSSHFRAKIADFGLSREDEEDGGEDTQFPVLWTAPEIVLRSRKKRNGKSEKKKFSHKSDVWSFGITMWEIFSFGEKPYKDFKLSKPADVKKHLKEHKTMAVPKEYFDDDISNDHVYHMYQNVISPCWKFDPAERPDFRGIQDRISTLENNYY